MRYFTHPLFPIGFMFSVLSAVTMTGCPTGGDLDDPDGHLGGISCDIQELFVRCGTAGCHEGPEASGSVDLITPGVEGRLAGVPATYENVRDKENCPTDNPELLLDPQDLEASLMLTKLTGSHSCGDRMPPGLPLNDAELNCVRQWLRSILDGNTGSNADAGAADDAEGNRQ